MTRRAAVIAAIGFFLWVGATRDAIACECMAAPSACAAASRAAAVFVGKVTSFTSEVQFEIERTLLGVRSGRITIENGPSTCALSFKVGERYVVYAYHDPSTGALTTGMCTRTRPVSDPRTRGDIAYLTHGQHGESRPLLTGVVRDVTVDLSTSIAIGRPLAAIPITARSLDGQRHRTTTTRTDGSYELTGLDAGRWSIVASLPRRFESHQPQTITITDGSVGCAEADIGARLDGRISGRLLDERGHPLRGVNIQLADVAAARAERWPLRTIDTSTDQDGNFEFRYVGPGRYVVGVALLTPVRPGRLNRRRFYNESLDPAAATVVTLDAAEHRQLPPFRLPPLPAERVITVVVQAPTTDVARGATLFLTGATRERLEQTGLPSTLRLPFGASYLLTATAPPEYKVIQPQTVQIAQDETDRTIAFRVEKP